MVSCELCWHINMAAHLVVIMDTQYFDGSNHRSVRNCTPVCLFTWSDVFVAVGVCVVVIAIVVVVVVAVVVVNVC